VIKYSSAFSLLIHATCRSTHSFSLSNASKSHNSSSAFTAKVQLLYRIRLHQPHQTITAPLSKIPTNNTHLRFPTTKPFKPFPASPKPYDFAKIPTGIQQVKPAPPHPTSPESSPNNLNILKIATDHEVKPILPSIFAIFTSPNLSTLFHSILKFNLWFLFSTETSENLKPHQLK
jgi:hypothetical protein